MPGIWTSENETRFAELLNEMSRMVGRDLTPETIEAYRRRMDDIDGDMACGGADACCMESRFWPTVAEMRERAGANNVPLMHERIESRQARRKAIGAKQTEKIRG